MDRYFLKMRKMGRTISKAIDREDDKGNVEIGADVIRRIVHAK